VYTFIFTYHSSIYITMCVCTHIYTYIYRAHHMDLSLLMNECAHFQNIYIHFQNIHLYRQDISRLYIHIYSSVYIVRMHIYIYRAHHIDLCLLMNECAHVQDDIYIVGMLHVYTFKITHLYIFVRMYIHVYIYIFIHTYIRECIYICIPIHIYMSTHTKRRVSHLHFIHPNMYM